MLINQESVPLAQLIKSFSVLLILGTVLTLPLFKFKWRKFISSSLFVKIIFWIPIFVMFLSLLYMNNSTRLIVLGILLGLAVREFLSVPKRDKLSTFYFTLFAGALVHFYFIVELYSSDTVNLLITICNASVLADVVAFFMGNYLGFHKLPQVLNERKSWEGVLGQIIGALAGVALVNTFISPVISLWLFLPIGIGSAVGDLANSCIKRRLSIRHWSKAIPGHGGYIDRLCSLAGAAVFTFYFLEFGWFL